MTAFVSFLVSFVTGSCPSVRSTRTRWGVCCHIQLLFTHTKLACTPQQIVLVQHSISFQNVDTFLLGKWVACSRLWPYASDRAQLPFTALHSMSSNLCASGPCWVEVRGHGSFVILWYALAQSFHNNSEVSVTIQPPSSVKGVCIVTKISELLWKLWASAYQRIVTHLPSHWALYKTYIVLAILRMSTDCP